jgi:trehalose/maltose transport system substrate-binding protein
MGHIPLAPKCSVMIDGVKAAFPQIFDVRMQLSRRTILGMGARLCTVALMLVVALFTETGCQTTGRGASGMMLTVIDQGWPGSTPRLGPEIEEFTRRTGIRAQILPAPEAAVEQLATWRELLDSRAEVPDVYAIDIIWPRLLADNLIDLKAYVPAEEIALQFPELIASYTVNGKLVALPHNTSEGLLYYRLDLLAKYGYRAPPRTWDELESMAKRIQAGERGKGKKDFWGYVWQGAPSEALTCNALEWQVSEGGGTILDEHGKVTVNNPGAIRAWSMAARWVGSISPPGVTAYKEWDAFNVWQAGRAAFMRNWTNAYAAGRSENSATELRFEVAPLPRGSAGFAATLGGNGYGVSRYSRHPREAAMLVRFLASPDEQASRRSGEPPTVPALYKNADVLAANPYLSRFLQMREAMALRPSMQAGKMYPDVSRAYFTAVHSVLTREKSAAQAASELQEQLATVLKGSASSKATLLQDEAAVASKR